MFAENAPLLLWQASMETLAKPSVAKIPVRNHMV